MAARAAAQQTITVGDIRVTYLPDGDTRLSPTDFLGNSSAETWQLHPEFLDENGQLLASIGGLLVETGDRRVLIDTGFGERHLDIEPFGPFDGGQLLASLESYGLRPEDVDTVAYTHLHLDHVGWTGRGAPDARVATFPNARYAVRRAEWDFWAGRDDANGMTLMDELPIRDRVELYDDDRSIAPGVTFLSTPGHTPGHNSVVISDGAERAIILGDVLHCPIQLSEADWYCVFDVDPDLARRTRESLLRELEGSATTVAAGHFSGLTFGRVLPGQGRPMWQSGWSGGPAAPSGG